MAGPAAERSRAAHGRAGGRAIPGPGPALWVTYPHLSAAWQCPVMADRQVTGRPGRSAWVPSWEDARRREAPDKHRGRSIAPSGT